MLSKHGCGENVWKVAYLPRSTFDYDGRVVGAKNDEQRMVTCSGEVTRAR